MTGRVTPEIIPITDAVQTDTEDPEIRTVVSSAPAARTMAAVSAAIVIYVVSVAVVTESAPMLAASFTAVCKSPLVVAKQAASASRYAVIIKPDEAAQTDCAAPARLMTVVKSPEVTHRAVIDAFKVRGTSKSALAVATQLTSAASSAAPPARLAELLATHAVLPAKEMPVVRAPVAAAAQVTAASNDAPVKYPVVDDTAETDAARTIPVESAPVVADTADAEAFNGLARPAVAVDTQATLATNWMPVDKAPVVALTAATDAAGRIDVVSAPAVAATHVTLAASAAAVPSDVCEPSGFDDKGLRPNAISVPHAGWELVARFLFAEGVDAVVRALEWIEQYVYHDLPKFVGVPVT